MGDEQAISDFPDEKQRSAVAYKQYQDEEMEEMQLPSVSILEEGEAKGHDLFVDKTSLQHALQIMSEAKNGVKVKMNHGSGLDAVVGFARNPRIEGNKLIADLKLLKNSPHYGLIKEMASEAPDQFGISLAFVNESETIDGKNFIRPQSIASADLVSSPAATNGLFEEMLAFMEKVKRFDCGTGAGGFQPGNSCASGGGGEGGGGGKENKSETSGNEKTSDEKRAQREIDRKISSSVRAASNDFKDNVIPESERSDEEINRDIDKLNKIERAVSRGDYKTAREEMNDLSTEAWDPLYKSGVHDKINANSEPKSDSKMPKIVQDAGTSDKARDQKLPESIKNNTESLFKKIKREGQAVDKIDVSAKDAGWYGSRGIYADNIKTGIDDFREQTKNHPYGPTTERQVEYYKQISAQLRRDGKKMNDTIGKNEIQSKWSDLGYHAEEVAGHIDKIIKQRAILEEGEKNIKKLVEFRCWEGYEEVAGKKPYSEGSCVKAETAPQNSDENTQMGYMQGGQSIPDDMQKTKKPNKSLTTKGDNMGTEQNKDIEDIKTRLSALEGLMNPEKMATKDAIAEVAKAEGVTPEEEAKEYSSSQMSEVVKKVLTEFGIKPVPASPVIEGLSKKEEPKTFEALVSNHPEYKTSKLTAMKAVMLSNPNEYREALARGIKNI
jgi:hypothetical protein